MEWHNSQTAVALQQESILTFAAASTDEQTRRKPFLMLTLAAIHLVSLS